MRDDRHLGLAMPHVRLIHWNADEAEARAGRLRALGHEVRADLHPGPTLLRELRDDPPAALVVDLSRLPSQGRDVAIAARQSPVTRGVPLVFVDGDDAKLAGIRDLLPDAVFTRWTAIIPALARVLARPPLHPVVPRSRLAGYEGAPLPKKLGIREGSRVVLAGAPDTFEATLGRLPPGATLRRVNRGERDLTLWFVASRRVLERGLEAAIRLARDAPLWIVWPKQRPGGPRTGLTQQEVRRAGLDAGLVDYKVCSVDETWSGLLFRRRASPRSRRRR